MEIPYWLNPYAFGKEMGEKWAAMASSQDPTKSNVDVLFEEIIRDVQSGRDLSQPYLNPLKEATRRGIVTSALSRAEEKLREVDLDSPTE